MQARSPQRLRKPLLQLLRTGDAEGKIMAAFALMSNLATNSDNKVATIAGARGVKPLVQLLRTRWGRGGGRLLMQHFWR